MTFLTFERADSCWNRRASLALLAFCGAIVGVISPAALATDTPDLGALQTLFATCAPVAHGWDRIEDADRVRYTRWDGQSFDGRKHQENLKEGTKVFPFEGASDVRIPTADQEIVEHVGFLTEAFWRAMGRVQGSPQTELTGQAAYARKLIEWVKGTKLYPELLKEITLHAQNGCTYGPSLIQVGWERTLGYRLHELKMEDLLASAQERASRGTQDLLTMFPQMIRDRKMDDNSVEVLQQIYKSYVESIKPSNYEWDAAPLSDKRARQAIRSLRRDGKAQLPLPYLCKNQPFVRARKLWEDCFVPEMTSSIQEAPAVFLFDYYPEAMFRAKGEAEEWDADWMEEAVKHKGEITQFTRGSNVLNDGTIVNGGTWGHNTLAESDVIEVVTCLRKLVDDDGILAVYETIYHANILGKKGQKKGAYALHRPIEFAIGLEYPLVEWRFEIPQRALCATRGIPQVVNTWQRTLKLTEDQVVDRSNMETVPPRLVAQKDGVNYIYGPAFDVPCLKPANPKPEYLALPPTSGSAEMLLKHVQARVDRYYGRPGMDVPPELSLIQRQQRARSFLLSCSQMLSFVFKLVSTQYPPELIAEITGLEGGSFGSSDEIADDTLYLLTFDIADLSPDLVAAKWKAVSEIEATDRSGTIDPAKSVRAKLRAVDPSLEQEICTDQASGNAATFKQVKGDFDDMFKGIPPQLTENDPTAQQQLQFADQIMKASPVYQESLKTLPHFGPLLQAWTKSKEFAVEQLGVNKQSGRVGVDMNAVMQQQQAGAGNTRT